MREKKLPLKTVLAVAGLTSVILIVSAVIRAIERSPGYNVARAPIAEVTAEKLWASFMHDEVYTVKVFGSAPVAVLGTVGTVDLGPTDDLYITLIDSSGTTLAKASMMRSDWSETAHLSRGQRVTLHCSAPMLAQTSLILRNCSLAEHPVMH